MKQIPPALSWTELSGLFCKIEINSFISAQRMGKKAHYRGFPWFSVWHTANHLTYWVKGSDEWNGAIVQLFFLCMVTHSPTAIWTLYSEMRCDLRRKGNLTKKL